jgi:hypothetical protein
VVIVLVALSFWLVASQLSKRVSPSASSAFSPAPAPNPIQLSPSPTGNGNYKPGTEAPAGGIVDWNRKNPSPNPATRSTASPSPQKLFAGTWQGTVHYVLTAANGSTIRKWDSQIELPIDDSETHWGKMKEEGGVFRRGRTLAYTGVSTGNDGSKHQVHATLMVSEDGRTATYTNSSRPMGGNSNQRTFGKGTLEKID